MKLYNTLTRNIDEFIPQDPSNVKIYSCGPTVYSEPHVGNFAAYIYWDTLTRALKIENYTINRIINFTDVGHLSSDGDEGEDKLEKGAAKENKTVWEIAEYYENRFLTHFRALNCVEPAKFCKATDYIAENIALIDTLTEKGYTYETTDGIYFDTSKFKTYADFAHLNLDGQKAGARVDFNDEKHNIADFALWKFIQSGETHAMRWDYRGRPGYPGWHIECSSIIHKELVEPIDIHTGGIDHIPIHHTNEIAQSEAAYDTPLSHFWLHNNFLTINGEKISKSLGNIYTFDDLVELGYTYTDFRMWVLEGHYQSERNFTLSNLTAAKERLLKWRNIVAQRHQTPFTETPDEHTKQLILDAISNNLNTASALAVIDNPFPRNLPTIQLIDDLFGLSLLDSTPDITDDQKRLIAERESARAAKDWTTSDQIRDKLAAQNLTILDSESGPLWQYLK